MTNAHWLLHLAPELTLLIGACAALLVGVLNATRRLRLEAPLALAVVLLALWISIRHGEPDGRTAYLGLWLNSITHYARLITLSVGALLLLINWVQPVAEERGEYFALILFSFAGILLTASANDWLVLFFAVELVSIPTYVLIALSRIDARASESTVKYFFLGALAAAFLAYGLSFFYGATGTTQIHHLHNGVATSALAAAGGLTGAAAFVGVLLVIAGLAFKIAAVPFHIYVSDVYEGAASPVTGLLGFVPKFAGFLALTKVLLALEWHLPDSVTWLLWIIAAVTMTAGNVLALLQHNVKRMLAYSSVAHTGYMLLGLLVGPLGGVGPLQGGLTAMFFYIAAYGVMNLGAFALLSFLRVGDREAETLDDLSGASDRAPLAALAFAVCIFSLMGLPPTGGFLGKLYLFGSAFSVAPDHPFRAAFIALAIIGVLNSAIGAAYYLRIVAAVYLGKSGEPLTVIRHPMARVALLVSALSMLILFARPGPLIRRAGQATSVVHRTLSEDVVRQARQTPAFPDGDAQSAAVAASTPPASR